MIQKLKKDKELNIEAIVTATVFQLEYVKQNMFVPGKIENWVIIADMTDLSINKLPLKET
jgi:hypothetical protein